jgi:hypothetical protein
VAKDSTALLIASETATKWIPKETKKKNNGGTKTIKKETAEFKCAYNQEKK